MTPETLAVAPEVKQITISRPLPVWREKIYLTGLIFLGLLLLIFHISGIAPATGAARGNGLFLINYIFPITYFVILLVAGKLRRGRNGLHPFFLFMIMFLLSAYSLNREFAVFETSVSWFSVLLVTVCCNYMAFVFFEVIPEALRMLMCVIAGVALVVFSYLALYLFPLYAFSLLGFILIGLSLHTFVPLLFCIYTLRLISKQSTPYKKYWVPFVASIVVSVILTAGYVVNWGIQQNRIERAFDDGGAAGSKLPAWVNVAATTSANFMTERILKTELIYDVPDPNSDIFWDLPMNSFEMRMHDPLVMLSSFINGRLTIPEKDRIAILKSSYDLRHEAQDRLWSGKDLITEQVDTRVKFWPEFRIAYTDIEVVTGYVKGPVLWPRQEEAIYTFHLPEGGVVTSLSLWIDGREEKGILTTKAKADSAYKTIVGVESRDPSVVHWQEGNAVSVRVFPVLRGSNRKFKLGITAPLRYDGKKLYYDNISLQGPSLDNTKQLVSVDLGNSSDDVDVPSGFRKEKNVLLKSGAFEPEWKVSVRAPDLSGAGFGFNQLVYSVAPLQKLYEKFSPANVYLDINSSWTMEECDRVYAMVRDRKVSVWNNSDFVVIDKLNATQHFQRLTANNFSLLPFHMVSENEPVLVVSKSASSSPTIDDLKSSKFLEELTHGLQESRSIYLFNLGTALSPYLRSLKELNAFHYDSGDEKVLGNLLETGRFRTTRQSDDNVPIHSAGLQIERRQGVTANKAPDHLMRLFAYNHILQNAGINSLTEQVDDPALINEAEEANVVSPVSSLVVLETQKDYDRFDIKSSKNSLENASLTSKGAVPEPHEWALIIIVVLLIAGLKLRSRLSLIRNR